MTGWVITVICLLLLGVAGFSVYRAFQSPKFVARITRRATKAAIKAIVPVITEPRDLKEMAEDQKEYRAGRGDDYWRRRSGAPPKG
jgi:hypothetical protein